MSNITCLSKFANYTVVYDICIDRQTDTDILLRITSCSIFCIACLYLTNCLPDYPPLNAVINNLNSVWVIWIPHPITWKRNSCSLLCCTFQKRKLLLFLTCFSFFFSFFIIICCYKLLESKMMLIYFLTKIFTFIAPDLDFPSLLVPCLVLFVPCYFSFFLICFPFFEEKKVIDLLFWCS